MDDCSIYQLHQDKITSEKYDISLGQFYLLRHHQDPAPLLGWLVLDACQHLSGPSDFTLAEASSWGHAVQEASRLIKRLTECDRVYAIAFGEGAHHLHLHLVPRFNSDSATHSWNTADLYRAVATGERRPADPKAVGDFVVRAKANNVTFIA